MAHGFEPALLNEINRWMFDVALPFWTEKGLDRENGGAVESLTLDGAGSSGAPFKRTRVICRQIYVFSHAQLLGASSAAAPADALYVYLTDRTWQGPDKGWPRTLDPITAEALDPTPDLYDYAFVLFALAWRHKATRSAEALAWSHRTLDLIEARFRHPSGGFHHELPPSLPRQQNPHMHMTEALLALFETSGEARFRDLANEIAGLFCTRIARFPDGVLPEFFDDEWRATPGEKGRWTEPGHQFEWAWILAQHQKLTGADNRAAIRALVQRAEAHGADPITQITFNGVRDDGVALDRGSRTWPNTERIKGWLGLQEAAGEDAAATVSAVSGSAQLLLDRYLGAPWPPGGWMDAFDGDGKPVAPNIPASTLYHVFLAFAELLRRAPALV